MKIVVLSTFDITPIRDGGQTRYVSVYKNIAKNHDVTLLAYDYRQSDHIRRYKLADRFDVISFPAATGDQQHFWHILEKTRRLAHDVLCIREYHLSDEFVRDARRIIEAADVVISSHPYLALLGFGFAKRNAIKIYESFNVEFDVKEQHFRGGLCASQLASFMDWVYYAERMACREAHFVTAVSESDAERMAELYDVPRSLITVAPNGVDCSKYPLWDKASRAELRSKLQIGDKPLAVFLGSGYGPNVESYFKARQLLSEAGFDGAVALIGSIAQADRTGWPEVPFDELWFDFVDEDLKIALLSSADFALQLVFSGGGTNLKLFDYMAAGCLIVANEFGARGVGADGWSVFARNATELRALLQSRVWETDRGDAIRAKARAIANEQFDWAIVAEKISSLFEPMPMEASAIADGSESSSKEVAPPPALSEEPRLPAPSTR
ncbi:glycosyltransferase family 4 protein [Methylosinus sporium]|uniref:Glycosyltransferase family 4 protein n=1 Tax=Methylosinus sporium TaxID=428 RepID=A0A549SUP6_METSR|nr:MULTISPECIES: glycosyltransferase [Methylosinus]MBU3890279.1 glycosyltransferase [Methylosinus sp. KRF6]TRL33359.1 glycosyltransferase family 4 protein [Methylosinus sporium]